MSDELVPTDKNYRAQEINMSTKLKISTNIIIAVLLQHLPVFKFQKLPAFNVYPNVYMPNNVQNGLFIDTNGYLQHPALIPYPETDGYEQRYKTKHRHHRYSIDFADAYSDYDYRDTEPEPNVLPTNLMQRSQSSVVIIPYPYPLLLSEVKTTTASTLQTKKAEGKTVPTITSAATTETTTSKVTTMSSTTTTAESTSSLTTTLSLSSPEESSGSKEEARRFLKPNTKNSLLHIEHLESMKRNSFRDIIAKVQGEDKKKKYILTSMRRTKLNWVPKYGIVPIPDQIAGKLIAQLQSYKDLQARRKDLRRMVALQHAKR